MLIDEYGGSHGIRDQELLLSTEGLPKMRAFGKELYPSLFLKAAVYARNVITSHPFLDGNKRSGIACAILFLENNGHRCAAARGEVVDYAVEIARRKPALEDIAEWLKGHSKRTRGKSG